MIRKCLVCGAEFELVRVSSHKIYCSEKCCAAAGRRRVKRSSVRKTRGLTFSQVDEVISAQDSGDIDRLRSSSMNWTKEQHKFAKERYSKIHGLFPVFIYER